MPPTPAIAGRSVLANRTAKHNPFSVQRMEKNEFQFPQGDWASQLAQLKQMGFRGAVVGRQGSGKTTFLLELRDRLQKEGRQIIYLFLSQDREEQALQVQRFQEEVCPQSICIVDGLERLNWIGRRRLFRSSENGEGLIVAVHRPCRVPTWIQTQTSLGLLMDLLVQNGIQDPATERLAADSFRRHQGNLRDVFRELYDAYAAGTILQAES